MPKPFMTIELQGLRRLRAKLGLLTKVEKKALQVEVRRALVNIERGAKRRAPLRTGLLRRSYTHRLDADKLGGRAGTNTFYAPFVEFGTRRMSAQPHLFPAFEEERPQFVQRAVRKIEDAHKRLARGSTTAAPGVTESASNVFLIGGDDS